MSRGNHLLTACVWALFVWASGIHSEATAQTYADADCGKPIGTLNSIPSRSNASDTGTWNDCGDKPAAPNQVYPITSTDGDPFQCVELIRRYYRMAVDPATSTWPRMNAASFYSRYTEVKLSRFPNGDPNPPQQGDIIVFGPTAQNSAGHVVIVTGVANDRVQIIEQNWNRYTGYGELRRRAGSSGWDLYRVLNNGQQSAYRVLGWLRKVSTSISYTYLSQFGSYGSGNGQFNQPIGVAIDPSTRNILVTDAPQGDRVQVFNASGVYLSQFGSTGTADGQFNDPDRLAVDPSTRNIVVVDRNNSRIQIFSPGGTYLRQFGTRGSGNGQFIEPTAVAVDAVNGNMLVTDQYNHRVQVFSAQGAYLSQFGTLGSGPGQFNQPGGIAIDPVTRNIVVVDIVNHRVQIFDPSGTFVSQFGRFGSGNGDFYFPMAVAVDPVSRAIIVADNDNNRVQVFSATGTYLTQFGSLGSGDGQFQNILGVAVDPVTRNIVVTDYNNYRVQIFRP